MFIHMSNISPQLADLHLKSAIQIQCRDEQKEIHAVVGRKKKKKTTCERTIASNHWTREGRTQAKKYPSFYCLYKALWWRDVYETIFSRELFVVSTISFIKWSWTLHSKPTSRSFRGPSQGPTCWGLSVSPWSGISGGVRFSGWLNQCYSANTSSSSVFILYQSEQNSLLYATIEREETRSISLSWK